MNLSPAQIRSYVVNGSEAARQFDASADYDIKILALAHATGFLVPILQNGYQIPAIAQGVGILLEKWGDYLLTHLIRGREASTFFNKAADYYRMAVDWPDDGNFSQARAKNSLRSLYVNARLPGTDSYRAAEAMRWKTEAADVHFAEAQFTLGRFFYAGRFCEQSYEIALHWFFRAQENKDQLTLDLRAELDTSLRVTQEKLDLSDPAPPYRAPCPTLSVTRVGFWLQSNVSLG
jgi:TPR repeat protein